MEEINTLLAKGYSTRNINRASAPKPGKNVTDTTSVTLSFIKRLIAYLNIPNTTQAEGLDKLYP